MRAGAAVGAEDLKHHVFELSLLLFGECGDELQQVAHKYFIVGNSDDGAGFFGGKGAGERNDGHDRSVGRDGGIWRAGNESIGRKSGGRSIGRAAGRGIGRGKPGRNGGGSKAGFVAVRVKLLIVSETADIRTEITVANRKTRQGFLKLMLCFHFFGEMRLQIIIHCRIGKIAVIAAVSIKLNAGEQRLSGHPRAFRVHQPFYRLNLKPIRLTFLNRCAVGQDRIAVIRLALDTDIFFARKTVLRTVSRGKTGTVGIKLRRIESIVFAGGFKGIFLVLSFQFLADRLGRYGLRIGSVFANLYRLAVGKTHCPHVVRAD